MLRTTVKRLNLATWVRVGRLAVLGVLKRRFLSFRKEAVVLWYAFRDPRTPFALKVASLLTGLYLASPIDLIPFNVPFLGIGRSGDRAARGRLHCKETSGQRP